MKKRIGLLCTVAVMITLVISAYGQAQQPNSCASPDAGVLRPFIGRISTKWNCWLTDYVYQFYRARGFSEYLAANYASQAVQRDAEERLNQALDDLRRSDPQYFDQVMAVHGLAFGNQ